jgi:hypothetical protein
MSILPPMITTRLSSSSIRRGDNIYVSGGDTHSLTQLSSMDHYHIPTCTWSPSRAMSCPRSSHPLLPLPAHDRCFMAVGGHKDTTGLKTCELYNPLTMKWSPLSSL